MKYLPFMVMICVALFSTPIQAYYEGAFGKHRIDLQGLLRGYGFISHYREANPFYSDQTSANLAGILRMTSDVELGKSWRFELNAAQVYLPRSSLNSQNNGDLSLGAERSDIFDINFSDSRELHLFLDRMALAWRRNNIDVIAGRQAINLSTTFYFTPNDFFAPFTAQTFYRVYKPGVDAMRLELGLGEFSQLSLMTVLGYQKSQDSWGKRPDIERSSSLIRWSNVYADMEVAFLAGRVTERNILGFSMQGELFDWLGLRLEGHHADFSSKDGTYQRVSVGIEHRWENTLELRLEVFYNGMGADKVSAYQAERLTGTPQYLAQYYTAFGAGYEITPLLLAQVLAVSNWLDQSHLFAANAVYSLSDESEMAVYIVLPNGKTPDENRIKSEFGAYPISATLEFRTYF
ncbi:MAG TPA: hypothetical protein ENK06_04670 [Gammaproteobacteria bacterium]|nr:hypothetical protein [Gammaproteobacteria bacterium]